MSANGREYYYYSGSFCIAIGDGCSDNKVAEPCSQFESNNNSAVVSDDNSVLDPVQITTLTIHRRIILNVLKVKRMQLLPSTV